jgi:transcriptional regulator with XRE-family HTH domain
MVGYIDFYERVKFCVKKNKTTIEYVVGQAGLSLASYNSYRRYENLPRADEAYIIAQTLGTSVEFLVSGNNPTLLTADDTLTEIESIIKKYRKNNQPARRKQ